MVRIDDAQAEEIKYIISQSMNGLHVLFDNDTIKRYLHGSENEDEVFDENKSRQTEKLIERFIKTYFSIVENNILNSRRLVN